MNEIRLLIAIYVTFNLYQVFNNMGIDIVVYCAVFYIIMIGSIFQPVYIRKTLCGFLHNILFITSIIFLFNITKEIT